MKPKRTVKMPLRRPATKPRAKPSSLRARAASVDPDYDLEDYEEETEPNMRFSHALFVVLILHVIAVAGVFAFNSIKARQAVGPEGSTASLTASATSNASTTSLSKTKVAQDKPGTHTVVAGDTLTRIASLHGTTIEAIEKENGITTYSTIRVGQVLQIPESKASSKPGIASSPAGRTAQAQPTPIQARVIATATKSAPPSEAATNAERFLATRQGAAAPPEQTSSSTSDEAPPRPSDGTYTVESGDNPYSIARKFRVSYQKLMEVNAIEDPTKIQIGQVLKLPPAE